MVAQSIRFFISGDSFSLQNFVNDTVFSENFLNQNKTNFKLDFKNNILIIWHPQKEYSKYYDKEYEEWYLKFIELYFEKLVKLGADDFELFYNCFYVKQCNIEIFSSDLLKKFSQYNISIPFTCVKYSQKDMKELAKKNNFEYEE